MAQEMTGSVWQFAVRTYGQPGVTEACLALQDERGADVVMLLFSVWAGTTRGRLGDDEFSAAVAFSRQWNPRAVVPQRAVRTWMKAVGCNLAGASTNDCLALRERIKQNELAAEKIQLEVLETILARRAPTSLTASDQLTHAVANLRMYCDAVDIKLDAWVIEHFAVILTAGVSSADLATIESIFSG